jgi:hypothetical protein
MTKRLVSLFVACTITLAAIFPPSGLTLPSGAADAAPVIIDISSLAEFLGTLPPDEQDEQLRDWAAYGLASSISPSSIDIPIRHPALRDAGPAEVSPGRVVRLSASEWGVVVPKRLLGNKPLIGGLVDRKHAETNRLPDRISLFTYLHDPGASTLTVAFERHIDPMVLYGPEYGYHSARVNTLSDFEGFVGQVDDLVSARWGARELILGGRKYSAGSRRALSVEEIADLYQAYNPPRDAMTRSRYEATIRAKYEAMLATDRSLRDSVRRGKVKKSRLMAKLRRESPFRGGGEVGIGFSLDTDNDCAALADDMEKLVQRPLAFLHAVSDAPAEAIRRRSREITAAARRIRGDNDIRPLLALRRKFSGTNDPDGRILDGILQQIEMRNSYSTARYDGRLQGTRAAMILFYTDLLAKLWALDYNGMATRLDVKGFRTMPRIAMPKLHWEEYRRLSRTRLWFGLRQEGFEVYGGNKALFQPVSTRVYAASSDPLAPGRESLPNYQSREFLGWWDRHYEALADHEPEYHKLNQIQKWSALFMLLKEGRSKAGGFLQEVPVARDLDFERWNRDNVSLKTRISVPFLDKSRYGRSTECLRLLSSTPFPLMGTVSMLSGGVSLASRKDILAKLHRHHGSEATPAHRSPGRRGEREKSLSPAPAGSPRKASPALASSSVPAVQLSRAGGPQRRRGAASPPVPSPPATRPVDAAREEDARDGGISPSVIKLKWEKSPAIAVIDFVTALATRQESQPAARGETLLSAVPEIRSVVRVEEGKTYLVRTAGLGESWIYLSVNPARVAEYPARASGSFPEADIFCAREISAHQARKLAAGKPVIR